MDFKDNEERAYYANDLRAKFDALFGPPKEIVRFDGATSEEIFMGKYKNQTEMLLPELMSYAEDRADIATWGQPSLDALYEQIAWACDNVTTELNIF